MGDPTMSRGDSTIDDHRRVLLAWALADAIPAELRRWTGQAAPEARVEALRDRLVTVWDTYVLDVNDRTQAQRWLVSEGLAASVCGYCATPAEEFWDWDDATMGRTRLTASRRDDHPTPLTPYKYPPCPRRGNRR
jgi:hypothetical protein